MNLLFIFDYKFLLRIPKKVVQDWYPRFLRLTRLKLLACWIIFFIYINKKYMFFYSHIVYINLHLVLLYTFRRNLDLSSFFFGIASSTTVYRCCCCYHCRCCYLSTIFFQSMKSIISIWRMIKERRLINIVVQINLGRNVNLDTQKWAQS